MMGTQTLTVLFILNCGSVFSSITQDWLIDRVSEPVTFTKSQSGTWRLQNGLIYREFITDPNFVTIDFYSLEKEQSLLRAIDAESEIALDGMSYKVGGVSCDIPRAYLNRTALHSNMKPLSNSFKFHSYKTMAPVAPFSYVPRRGAPKNIVWPPKGLRLDIEYRAPDSAPTSHKDVAVFVHYEMYIGIPLLVKWISATPLSAEATNLEIKVFSVEYLSVNEQWGSTPNYQGNNDDRGWLYVETDQSHGTSVTWGNDAAIGKMPGSIEPAVNCTYHPIPRHITVGEDGGFESFRVHELLIGSSDPERGSLSRHRMFRTLAPHTQENPIFFHMTKSDSTSLREVIDQMHEVGFELMILSFGSGFNMESTDESYIQRMTHDIAYANSKGIEVGGYDLIVLTRKVQESWMATNPATNKSIGSACIASGWYDELLTKMLLFMDRTGLSNVETDGPYGGQTCGSKDHKHHIDEYDSVYRQQKLQGRMYTILREKGVYINQPDHFFYQGGSRTGLGYNENQYSLPRWQDLSVSRQSVYDDTYRLIPTAGWMFTPLVDYHAGGAPAAFEPLKEHLTAYEWALATYLGAGVAACYRGPRLYDSNVTKSLVKKWVDFYKTYRDIVTSDIVHIRRPDMQSIDSFMHVNPYIDNKALAMVFNPTLESLTQNITLPLYYTGLTSTAKVYHEGMTPLTVMMDRNYRIQLNISLAPLGITWFLIK